MLFAIAALSTTSDTVIQENDDLEQNVGLITFINLYEAVDEPSTRAILGGYNLRCVTGTCHHTLFAIV